VLVVHRAAESPRSARKHFAAFETLVIGLLPGSVANNEDDQTVTTAAFAVLHFIATRRTPSAGFSP
jgi:hypothetical protein